MLTEAAGMRVGTDLVRVAEVEQALATFGDRYLQRVYTPREIEQTRSAPAVRCRRLAARFAGKEAVVKVLRPQWYWLDWRAIEILSVNGGWTEVALHGAAAELGAAAGVQSMSISLSHEDDFAIAVIAATFSTRP